MKRRRSLNWVFVLVGVIALSIWCYNAYTHEQHMLSGKPGAPGYDQNPIVQLLKAQGYQYPTLTGYSPFACGEEDDRSEAFTATARDGQRVRGVVCFSNFNGYVTRITGIIQ